MGIYQWSSRISKTDFEDLGNKLQKLTGLENITVSEAGLRKNKFNSTIENIQFENGEIFILEPIGGPVLNKYLDCSFYFLLKQIGSPTKRRIPHWAGMKWQRAKYIPWVRIRK